jgi:hypothetical protein
MAYPIDMLLLLACALAPAGVHHGTDTRDAAALDVARGARQSPAVDGYLPRGARVMNARLLAAHRPPAPIMDAAASGANS